MKFIAVLILFVSVFTCELVSHFLVYSGHDIALVDSLLESESENEKQDSSEDETEEQKDFNDDILAYLRSGDKLLSLLNLSFILKVGDSYLEILIPPPDLV